jgi:hypothetical protein
MVTIEERQASAAARWDRAVKSVSFGWADIARSRWLLTSSRAVLDRPRPPFRGGGDPPLDWAAVRARVRMLIDASLLPKIFAGQAWAGPCESRHECAVCRIVIEVGEVEYELPLGGVQVFVHRRCFVLLQTIGSGGEPA